MSLQTTTLVLSGAQLSDLFFNYDHPKRDKLYESDADFTEAELNEALLDDAKEFCSVVGLGLQCAQALVDDFQHRV